MKGIYRNTSFCFDVAHAHLYSKLGYDVWLDQLSDLLDVMHISDNDGKVDVHKAIGKGTINFSNLFRRIKQDNIKPEYVLELNKREDIVESIYYLQEYCS